jgi:hypothetical protein
MRDPRQTCTACGRSIIVEQTGRGFPPDVAKRKLQKACKANGCPCTPVYTAGLLIGPRPSGQAVAGKDGTR